MKLFKKTPANQVPSRRRSAADAMVPEIRTPQHTFRRNRTLTGSSSAVISSSNELNAELKSPRAHVHHLTNIRRRLLVSFASVAIVSFSLYFLISQLVASATVQRSGTGTLPDADQKSTMAALESYYAARPTERLRFLLNNDELLSHVQSARPEIKSVRVEPGGSLGTAVVSITARKPLAVWKINGEHKYVDAEGVVFDKNYYGEPALEIIDNSGLSGSSSGSLITSNRFLGFIGRVIASASESRTPIATVSIPALTTRQITVTMTSDKTQYKLSIERGAGEQVEDIARVSKYLAANKLSPGYVDVRIRGKAFYK